MRSVMPNTHPRTEPHGKIGGAGFLTEPIILTQIAAVHRLNFGLEILEDFPTPIKRRRTVVVGIVPILRIRLGEFGKHAAFHHHKARANFQHFDGLI